jgi:hypothetical protein
MLAGTVATMIFMNVLAAKRTGVQIDTSGHLADAQRCVRVLKLAEKRSASILLVR